MEIGYINNWHRIWSKRKLTDITEGTVMEKLISIDGFDSPLGLMAEADWREYVNMFAKRSRIIPGDSIYEVGCGGGAFLYPFYELDFEISGLDYSQELINVARVAMPLRKDFLEVAEASACESEMPDSIVIANHVIHYFTSLDYAAKVLLTMLKKATKTVAVSGIPDAQLKTASEVARRGLLSEAEYDLKYKGLEILYFERSWFQRLAQENGFAIQFFEHTMPGFAQNQFRYDCVMTKK
jgi:SAM-dependent methyltransferase